ncbi:MAG: RDD family protein [Gordonia sp. (in: high G+C Gram-positive bacteria)]
MGRATGSWLSGPASGQAVDVEYRGADLGFAQSGPGSLAGGWHRVLALLIDWLIGYGIALLVVRVVGVEISTVVLGVWFIIGAACVTLFGFTPGQCAAGLRVARVDHGPERTAAEISGQVPLAAVGVVRALARQLLIVFIVPALMNDYNARALHDRATGTALVRTR